MKLRNLFILAMTAATLVACGGGNTGNGGNNNNGNNNGSVGNAGPVATSDSVEVEDRGAFDPTPPPVELDDQEPGQGVEDPQVEPGDQEPGQGVEDPQVDPEADAPANPDNGNDAQFDPCRFDPGLRFCNPVDIHFPTRGQVNPLPPFGNNNGDDEPAAEEEQAEQAVPNDEFARRREACLAIPDRRSQQLCLQDLFSDIFAAQQEEEARREAANRIPAQQEPDMRLDCDGQWAFERNANGIGGQIVCRPIEDPCAEFAEDSIDYIRCVADLAHNS
ncbi:MAG: hypothetical protein HYU97_06960 [Deltaproteobacteria bacterium]|nr:hypothetical protein [Deltaproteobacteria bacterium]